jgi:hypothetical protein
MALIMDATPSKTPPIMLRNALTYTDFVVVGAQKLETLDPLIKSQRAKKRRAGRMSRAKAELKAEPGAHSSSQASAYGARICRRIFCELCFISAQRQVASGLWAERASLSH